MQCWFWCKTDTDQTPGLLVTDSVTGQVTWSLSVIVLSSAAWGYHYIGYTGAL